MVYHSSNGGNDWKLSAVRLPRGPLCAKMNVEYRKFLMNELHKVSKLPYSEDINEDICPTIVKVRRRLLLNGQNISNLVDDDIGSRNLNLEIFLILSFKYFQGDYELKNYMYDSNNNPKFLQSGLYKVQIISFLGNTMTGGVEVVVTLS